MPETKDPAPAPGAGFEALSLDPRIQHAIARLGFTEPTPIQRETIPAILTGRDVIGRARTGSGKTAAFGLPLLSRLAADPPKGVRALVLAPTRELALQVTEALQSFARGLPLRIATIYGGAAYRPQIKALTGGVPIVVGTPGRIIDHLGRGTLDLSALELLVLDEADEMLRMGFIDEVEQILAATPDTRQVALFSATMPPAIRKVAEAHLEKPIEVQVEGGAFETGHIEQRGMVVPHRHKLDALLRILAMQDDDDATLVFARTRAGCAEVAEQLTARGLRVDALHGDLSQPARERVLDAFRRRQIDLLVATDVAARGIDVSHISHVVNLDLPADHESYVHRIGRTGRAGRAGVAISLVTPREAPKMRGLERALRTTIDKAQVPTDADIDAHRRARLVADLEAAAAEEAPAARALYEALAEGHGPEDIARAALALLGRERHIDPTGAPSDAPPAWAPKPKAARGPRTQRDRATGDREAVDLFLPVGKARGVRPADLVGALTNDLGADRTQIGRITILPHKTFLRVHPDLAARILEGREHIRLRGRDVPVARARPHGGPAPVPHRRGNKPPRPKRPPGNKKKKHKKKRHG